ncbi:hypothetical protein ACFJIV_25530 [Mucilaginibacter sp. UC70_90]
MPIWLAFVNTAFFAANMRTEVGTLLGYQFQVRGIQFFNNICGDAISNDKDCFAGLGGGIQPRQYQEDKSCGFK